MPPMRRNSLWQLSHGIIISIISKFDWHNYSWVIPVSKGCATGMRVIPVLMPDLCWINHCHTCPTNPLHRHNNEHNYWFKISNLNCLVGWTYTISDSRSPITRLALPYRYREYSSIELINIISNTKNQKKQNFFQTTNESSNQHVYWDFHSKKV